MFSVVQMDNFAFLYKSMLTKYRVLSSLGYKWNDSIQDSSDKFVAQEAMNDGALVTTPYRHCEIIGHTLRRYLRQLPCVRLSPGAS